MNVKNGKKMRQICILTLLLLLFLTLFKRTSSAWSRSKFVPSRHNLSLECDNDPKVSLCSWIHDGEWVKYSTEPAPDDVQLPWNVRIGTHQCGIIVQDANFDKDNGMWTCTAGDLISPLEVVQDYWINVIETPVLNIEISEETKVGGHLVGYKSLEHNRHGLIFQFYLGENYNFYCYQNMKTPSLVEDFVALVINDLHGNRSLVETDEFQFSYQPQIGDSGLACKVRLGDKTDDQTPFSFYEEEVFIPIQEIFYNPIFIEAVVEEAANDETSAGISFCSNPLPDEIIVYNQTGSLVERFKKILF